KTIFTTFIGFFGSPGFAGFFPFAHYSSGGTHPGFHTMWRTEKRPIGVGLTFVPTATVYVLTSVPPIRTTRIFFCVLHAIDSGPEALLAAGTAGAMRKRERKKRMDARCMRITSLQISCYAGAA